jgi:predicted MFS family arabinose efflux permease
LSGFPHTQKPVGPLLMEPIVPEPAIHTIKRVSPQTIERSAALIWLLSIGAGIGVASVYYIQPVLPLVQETFVAGSEQVGLVPALTQAGYAAGMLILAPLGDLIDRKRLIVTKALLLIVALIASAVAPTLSLLVLAGVVVGALGSIGQDFVPVAAQIAPDAHRGRTVAIVTTGLLTGILLSRTLSGFIADAFGWRAVYWIAAGLVALVAAAVWRFLPSFPPTMSGSYGALLRSLATLVRQHPALRKSVLTQALLATSLGAFWSTLALMLAGPPFHLGASVAGTFGLAGAAGAFGAPIFGHMTDRAGPNVAIRLGCVLVALSFGAMMLMPGSVPVLVASAILFDLGVMAGLVSHQSIINALDPAARSRLNGLLMTAAMLGVALGAGIGGWAWSHYGWTGVCMVGAAAGVMALLRSLLPQSKRGMTPMTSQPPVTSRPHLRHLGTEEPLTVVFSFLSRADSTPIEQRRRGEGHLLDTEGRVIPDPAADPGANAFEADPNLNFEKWGEYWRKVHGVRFLYPEEPDDRSIERLQRYDQIHRIAAGPASPMLLPYRAPVDEAGRLFPTIIGHIPPYRRPRWDGVAYLNFESPEDIATVLANDRVRTKILPEDRTIFRDIAPVLSRQFIILPSETGNDAISLVKTHVRRPDIDRAAFQHRWLHEHADLVLAQPDTHRFVKRYVQLHNTGPTIEGEPFFHPETSLIDGVTLMTFATMNDVEEFLLTDGHRSIESDERLFCPEVDYRCAINFSVLNRIQPELTTRRE